MERWRMRRRPALENEPPAVRAAGRSMRLRIQLWMLIVFVAMISLMTVSSIGHLHGSPLPAIAVHAAQGIVGLAVLVGGAEWILRRRLLDPLDQISRQIVHMKRGGGWTPHLPEVDGELTMLRRELGDFADALTRQYEASVEAERRAAAALVAAETARHTRDPIVHARATLSDLHARRHLDADSRRKLRALARDLDDIVRIVNPHNEPWVVETLETPAVAAGNDQPGLPAVSPGSHE